MWLFQIVRWADSEKTVGRNVTVLTMVKDVTQSSVSVKLNVLWDGPTMTAKNVRDSLTLTVTIITANFERSFLQKLLKWPRSVA